MLNHYTNTIKIFCIVFYVFLKLLFTSKKTVISIQISQLFFREISQISNFENRLCSKFVRKHNNELFDII